jgi:hypothetical protein
MRPVIIVILYNAKSVYPDVSKADCSCDSYGILGSRCHKFVGQACAPLFKRCFLGLELCFGIFLVAPAVAQCSILGFLTLANTGGMNQTRDNGCVMADIYDPCRHEWR